MVDPTSWNTGPWPVMLAEISPWSPAYFSMIPSTVSSTSSSVPLMRASNSPCLPSVERSGGADCSVQYDAANAMYCSPASSLGEIGRRLGADRVVDVATLGGDHNDEVRVLLAEVVLQQRRRLRRFRAGILESTGREVLLDASAEHARQHHEHHRAEPHKSATAEQNSSQTSEHEVNLPRRQPQ